jgi:cell division transport system permease protein
MFDLSTYALQEALASFRRTKMMSFVSIGIMGVSLFILGLFLLLSRNVEHIINQTKEKVEIVAYLEDGVSEEERLEILGKIRMVEYINNVEFLSKEDALNKFQSDFSDRKNLLKSIPYNPFPASFQISLGQYQSGEQVESIARKIAEMNGVEDVVFGKKWLGRLDYILRSLRKGSLALGIIIAIAAIFVISNTIKLTVFARREAIQIMRLVGATNGFIRFPFVLEGMLYGALGSFLALGLIYVGYFWAKHRFPYLIFLPPEYQLILVGFGIVLGAVGSWISLQKFLKV